MAPSADDFLHYTNGKENSISLLLAIVNVALLSVAFVFYCSFCNKGKAAISANGKKEEGQDLEIRNVRELQDPETPESNGTKNGAFPAGAAKSRDSKKLKQEAEAGKNGAANGTVVNTTSDNMMHRALPSPPESTAMDEDPLYSTVNEHREAAPSAGPTIDNDLYTQLNEKQMDNISESSSISNTMEVNLQPPEPLSHLYDSAEELNKMRMVQKPVTELPSLVLATDPQSPGPVPGPHSPGPVPGSHSPRPVSGPHSPGPLTNPHSPVLSTDPHSPVWLSDIPSPGPSEAGSWQEESKNSPTYADEPIYSVIRKDKLSVKKAPAKDNGPKELAVEIVNIEPNQRTISSNDPSGVEPGRRRNSSDMLDDMLNRCKKKVPNSVDPQPDVSIDIDSLEPPPPLPPPVPDRLFNIENEINGEVQQHPTQGDTEDPEMEMED
ncbi:histone-lysine N-methyltransferase 2D-like [Hyperolius riggenbachi]|uniref:histone-lysine N-methyltransferase 2D-like n=1 Tax=Hyperolius riggenbachi TaxID=752182 RepID=UPI0035A2AFD9